MYIRLIVNLENAGAASNYRVCTEVRQHVRRAIYFALNLDIVLWLIIDEHTSDGRVVSEIFIGSKSEASKSSNDYISILSHIRRRNNKAESAHTKKVKWFGNQNYRATTKP